MARSVEFRLMPGRSNVWNVYAGSPATSKWLGQIHTVTSGKVFQGVIDVDINHKQMLAIGHFMTPKKKAKVESSRQRMAKTRSRDLRLARGDKQLDYFKN